MVNAEAKTNRFSSIKSTLCFLDKVCGHLPNKLAILLRMNPNVRGN